MCFLQKARVKKSIEEQESQFPFDTQAYCGDVKLRSVADKRLITSYLRINKNENFYIIIKNQIPLICIFSESSLR